MLLSRSQSALVALLVVAASLVGPLRGNAGDSDKPWTLRNYFGLENPKELAKEILVEAVRRGYDLDQRGSVDHTGPIMFPSGPFDPSDRGEGFIAVVHAMRASRLDDVDTMIVVQTKRSITIREFAGILDLGITVYWEMGTYAFIAGAPLSAIPELAALEFVKWIGAYTPSHKLSVDNMPLGDVHVTVHSLMRDKSQFREDLAALGANVVRYSEAPRREAYVVQSYYRVDVDAKQVPLIAQLSWVRLVGWSPPPQRGESPLRDLIYQSEDPRKAATELLLEADKRGRVDLVNPISHKGPIMVPSGPLYPSDDNSAFIVQTQTLAQRRPDADTVIVFRFDRAISIRELAHVMRMGVRLLWDLPGYSTIASINLSTIAELHRVPYVDWVGAYEPSFKYNATALPGCPITVTVHSLFRERPEFADDLKHIGGRNVRHFTRRRSDGYYVDIDNGAMIPKLAGLDWVRSIEWRRSRPDLGQ